MLGNTDSACCADRKADASLDQGRHINSIVITNSLMLNEAQAGSCLDSSARQPCRGCNNRLAVADLDDSFLVIVLLKEHEFQGRRLQTLHEVVNLRRAEAVIE